MHPQRARRGVRARLDPPPRATTRRCGGEPRCRSRRATATVGCWCSSSSSRPTRRCGPRPAQRVRRPALVPELVAEVACVDGGWRVARARTASTRRARRTSTRSSAVIGGCRSCSSRPTTQRHGARRRRPLRGRPRRRSRTSWCSTASAAVAALDAELGCGSWRAARWRAPAVAVVAFVRPARSTTRSGGPRRWPGPTARGHGSRRSSRTSCVGAATLRVEGDPLVERLARSQDTIDLQERRGELESLRTAVLGDRAAAEELISEYQTELTRADEQVYAARGGPRTRARAADALRARLPHARDRRR